MGINSLLRINIIINFLFLVDHVHLSHVILKSTTDVNLCLYSTLDS